MATWMTTTRTTTSLGHGGVWTRRSGLVGRRDKFSLVQVSCDCRRVSARRGIIAIICDRGDCNMMAVMTTACWIALVLLTFCSASAIARIGPGAYPSVKTISHLEQTPRTFANNGNIQDQQTPQEVKTIFGKNYNHGSTSSRRELVGSSPPTCIDRCGTCVPCTPVHVAITSPHPVISETDYYPEVWQCLCGNNYYMP